LAAVSFVAYKSCVGFFADFDFGEFFKTSTRVISSQFARAWSDRLAIDHVRPFIMASFCAQCSMATDLLT